MNLVQFSLSLHFHLHKVFRRHRSWDREIVKTCGVLQVRQGRSALHVACSAEGARGRGGRAWLATEPAPPAPPARLVTLMLRLGAPPDARDADGNTPLHLVCKVCTWMPLRHLLRWRICGPSPMTMTLVCRSWTRARRRWSASCWRTARTSTRWTTRARRRSRSWRRRRRAWPASWTRCATRRCAAWRRARWRTTACPTDTCCRCASTPPCSRTDRHVRFHTCTFVSIVI